VNFPRADTFHSETKLIVSSNANVDGLPLVITLGSEFGQQDQSTNFRVPVLLPHWIEKASPSISVTSYGTSRFSIHVMISFVDHQSWRFAFSSINGNGSFSITRNVYEYIAGDMSWQINWRFPIITLWFLTFFTLWFLIKRFLESFITLLFPVIQIHDYSLLLPFFPFSKNLRRWRRGSVGKISSTGTFTTLWQPPNVRFHSFSPSLRSYSLIV